MLFKSFVIFLLSFNLYSKVSSKKRSEIKKVTKSIDHKKLKKKMNLFLKESFPIRFPGEKGHQKARNYILKELQTISGEGIEIIGKTFKPDYNYARNFYIEDFNKKIAKNFKKSAPEYQKWKKFTDQVLLQLKKLEKVEGENIHFYKKTANAKGTIYIGAHYDVIGFDHKKFTIENKGNFPGADDNATGVLALLELAKGLAKLEMNYNLHFIFWDFNKFGFLGSRHFFKRKDLEIDGKKDFYINLFMLGKDTKTQDRKKRWGNYEIYLPYKSFDIKVKSKEIAEKLLKSRKNLPSRIDFSVFPEDLLLTDAENFKEAGIPSLLITHSLKNDSGLSNQHTKNDFAEVINYKSFASIIKTLIVGLATLE